jgi:hypothetical protein
MIPRDKPRTWVIFIGAVFLAVLVCGPIGVMGVLLHLNPLYRFGVMAFIACWFVAVIALLVFLPGHLSGKYRDLPARPWKEQVW